MIFTAGGTDSDNLAVKGIYWARRDAEPTLPDTAHTYRPPPLAPLFVVTIRCRDGERVQLRLFENLHGRGLTPSATLAARKIAAVLTHYRPAP